LKSESQQSEVNFRENSKDKTQNQVQHNFTGVKNVTTRVVVGKFEGGRGKQGDEEKERGRRNRKRERTRKGRERARENGIAPSERQIASTPRNQKQSEGFVRMNCRKPRVLGIPNISLR